MAGRIRRDDIEALKERADIAAVIGDHTELKRAGSRLKGLCPFHSEKTPSFTVDPGQGYYHCFGCGEGGDVYSFLMRVQGLDFTEAVEQLARRTGYDLHYEDLSPGQRRALGERSRLVELTTRALEFFREQLLGTDGEVARSYLKERGFGREDAEAFQLGYAPNEWEALSRALVTEGWQRRDLVKVGLSVENQRGGLRDRFRGRLVFPVLDASGDAIGFGGRILPGLDYGDFEPPKYYNSPETPLYHKARVLYGLPQSRTGMAATGEVLVCEGYTDVMALHQAGITNAVATCGTAVGADHFRLLGRYVNRVVLAFDADEAGVKAAERAVQEAGAVDDESGGDRFSLRVLAVDQGGDPADMVRAQGAEAVQAAVAGAEPVVGFLIDAVIARADLDSDEGRTTALRAAVQRLGEEPDPDLRRLWARTRIADPLGVSVQWVQSTARRLGVAIDRQDGVATVPMGRRSTQSGPVARASRGDAAMQRRVLRVALQEPALVARRVVGPGAAGLHPPQRPGHLHDPAGGRWRRRPTAGSAGGGARRRRRAAWSGRWRSRSAPCPTRPRLPPVRCEPCASVPWRGRWRSLTRNWQRPTPSRIPRRSANSTPAGSTSNNVAAVCARVAPGPDPGPGLAVFAVSRAGRVRCVPWRRLGVDAVGASLRRGVSHPPRRVGFVTRTAVMPAAPSGRRTPARVTRRQEHACAHGPSRRNPISSTPMTGGTNRFPSS